MSVSFKLKMSLYSGIPSSKFTDAKVVKTLLLVDENSFFFFNGGTFRIEVSKKIASSFVIVLEPI